MKNVETLMRSLTIGGYHKHRQDLRKLICFGKICDTTLKQVQPTTKNTQSWHTGYLLRLHNDLPLIPPLERKAVATILQNSPKITENPNHTPPNVITVPFEQRLHSDRGEYKLVKPKLLGKTQKLSQNSRKMVKMKMNTLKKPS